MTTKEGWIVRKRRYGPTGAKNPEAFSEKCSQSQMGHRPYAGFKDHDLGPVCEKCEKDGKHGKTHGSVEPRIRNLQRWREEHGSPTKGCNYGTVCLKHGVNHGPAGMQGKHHSEESKRKSSLANRVAKNRPEAVELARQQAIEMGKNPVTINRRLTAIREHQEAIQEEIQNLQGDGYDAIDLDNDIRPDILARKDGKIIAVEVDFGRTKFDKYDMTDGNGQFQGIRFFDDVFWVVYREANRQHQIVEKMPKIGHVTERVVAEIGVYYSAICQTCGKEFKYKIKTANRKYCSLPCYYRSMDGKVPVAAMRARGLV